MPLISFSGVTDEGPFWEQILNGRKIQTCRRPRKRPIKKGDLLFLYWKCRVPKHKKPIHFIGKAVCLNVERKKYKDFWYDEDFAKKDGFSGRLELVEWFGLPDIYGEDIYDVISFKLITK